jgi:hypothetical protein
LHAIRARSDIAKNAADAAVQSAETAKLALHIDRPFLVPDQFKFQDEALASLAKFLTDENVKRYILDKRLIHPATVWATFQLKNYGKGPAVMGRIVGRISVIKSFENIPVGDFTDCDEWMVARSVLGVGDQVAVSSPLDAILGRTNPKAGWLTVEEQLAVVGSQALLVVYGQVTYTDLFDATFYADFFWMYSSFVLVGTGSGQAIQGPKERNRNHQ